jgi:thiamine-monophosphate kinase
MNTDTTVREIGEFGLIRALRDALPESVRANDRLSVAIGDDAAAWTPTPGESIVVTTDSLIEDIHFCLAPGWTDWRSLGHKALAVNLSDLAAMGAVPGLATISIGLRGTERVADLVALYDGMGTLAKGWNCLIAGGDIVASPAAFSLHVTAIGETRGGHVLRRAGAMPGDIVAVSGTLGAAAAGLELLRTHADDPRRAATTADLLIAAHLRPTPRLDLSPILVEHGATAAMDLSDGLFGDLPKILDASGVAARVDEVAIPVAAAVRALFPDRWLDLATHGGEDFELLFTAPPDRFAAIVAAASEIGATVTPLGEIVASKSKSPRLELRRTDGAVTPITAGAFDHFLPSDAQP